MYLSLHRYWGIDVHRLGGDLSYGTYLYGWPVQMMVLTIFGNQIGVLNFAALSLVLSSPSQRCPGDTWSGRRSG